MGGMRTLDPAAREGVAPSAVVWINGREASVVAVSSDGRISTCDISRGWLPEQSYLARVVRVIGACQRVMILGGGPGTATQSMSLHCRRNVSPDLHPVR